MASEIQYPVYPPVMALPVLNSWKEISSYVGRAVRTVQRWEAECKFPVHRPMGKNRTGVIAFPAEINEWMEHTPVRDDTIVSENPTTLAHQAGIVHSFPADSSKLRNLPECLSSGANSSKKPQPIATTSVCTKAKPAGTYIGAENLQQASKEPQHAKVMAMLRTDLTAIFLATQQAMEVAGLPTNVASKLKLIHETAGKMRSCLDAAA